MPPVTSSASSQSPPLSVMSLSSTMDSDAGSPRTDTNPSLEASLDPAQWVNAGTPEVFYRRARMEPLNRTPVNDLVIADPEEAEEDDIIAVPFESDSPPSEDVDLAIILRTFQEDHLSHSLVSTICVRRRKLLESAVKAISRNAFCWTHSPLIEFVGEDADDMGGPQREFFRLLMIEVQTSLGIFEGKAGQLFLSYDQAALDQRKYFRGGNLIAWSIAHGGPCIRALDPSLFQLMCGQEPPLEQFDWRVLPDPDVQSKVNRILQCKTAGDLTQLQQDLGDWIAECGVPSVFSATVEDIPKVYAYVVKHYIFLRTAKMILQFTDGMNAFGKLWDLVRKNWIAFLPLFTNMQEPMSKAAFKALFSYNYSRRGSNHREAEEDTIYSWEMVLNMIEDKVTDLKFEDLLIFTTGADEVPPLGFPRKPSIDFYEQEAGLRRLPYASTCTMCLYLPRGVSQEEELHEMILLATRGSLGFGKV
ncbi:G2/M phase-specific E3 ubiquitin-protein ligase-like [Micropterus salmoides]|uniref:G2/M phase-specific E3 ubiquitin-protein ligase-like n=1 Tax=Micropterus salmoides TaxID=27706 RepID=UPI0018ECCE29|nr:G2/M phase-specific E3 ubiquitin-protein ligase-like [Micropterus salmoides]XP_038560056.1 G2/M phase-specific E3 ubiquitin-protein ligase-like [Micropterus salmoides]